jgi:hypothetical protein
MSKLDPDRQCTIYGLYSTEDGITRYIGRTINPLNQRLSEHLYDARHPEYSLCPDTHKGRWIRKAEENGYTIHIRTIEETTVSIQDEREKYWVAYFGRENLVNGTDGGETVNVEKNPYPTVSFERIRTCLKQNNKKNLVAVIRNIHMTRYGKYSLQDVLDEEYRKYCGKKYKLSLSKDIKIEEFIKLMNDVINREVAQDIVNLKKIYNTKVGKEIVEFGYEMRWLQRARYIPKTSTKLDDMLNALYEEKEYGIYRYDDED